MGLQFCPSLYVVSLLLIIARGLNPRQSTLLNFYELFLETEIPKVLTWDQDTDEWDHVGRGNSLPKPIWLETI